MNTQLCARVIVLFLSIAVPTVQASTQARLTGLQIAALTQNASRLLEQIQLDDPQLIAEDQALVEEASAAPLSHRESVVLARLENKLPRAERTVAKRIQSMSDAEVQAELTQSGHAAAAAGEERETLHSLYVSAVRSSLPGLAKEVVSAGGMIPYLLHAKSLLKKQDAASSATEANSRSDVGAFAVCTVLFVVSLSLLIGWAVVLTTFLGLGVVFLAVYGVKRAHA